MQSVLFNAVVAGCSTRSDGSLGIRLSTGEFTPEDKLAVFNLQNCPCEVTLRPNDAGATPPKEIKGALSRQTPSQRMRSVLFVWWHQLGEPGQFEPFYLAETEKMITTIKAKLKP